MRGEALGLLIAVLSSAGCRAPGRDDPAETAAAPSRAERPPLTLEWSPLPGSGENLALGRPTTLSRPVPGAPSGWRVAAATQGESTPLWGATTWVEVDLEEPRAVGAIELRLSQVAPGESVHRIFGSLPGRSARSLEAVYAVTRDGDSLVIPAGPTWGLLQVIRIETLPTAAAIGIAQISIFGREPGAAPVEDCRTRASSAMDGHPSVNAVDGSEDSAWRAGGEPPQWIELTLARAVRLGAIRLQLSQAEPGETVHRILATWPGQPPQLLREIHAATADGAELTVAADPSWDTLMRTLRLETIKGPGGGLGFREIEILAAPPETMVASAESGSLVNVARGRPTAASSAAVGQESRMAVDGSTATAWRPGDWAPSWIEISLGPIELLGEVRLHLRQARPGETHQRVLALVRDAPPRLLGQMRGVTADGDVLIARADPAAGALPIRAIVIQTLESPGPVGLREIEILATTASTGAEAAEDPGGAGEPVTGRATRAPRPPRPWWRNLAHGATSSASSDAAATPSRAAVDGAFDSAWRATGPAPQWLEIDLGTPRRIERVCLHLPPPGGDAAGETKHRVFARAGPGEPARLLATLVADGRAGAALTARRDRSWGDARMRFVRVETVSSTLAGMRELEVWGR